MDYLINQMENFPAKLVCDKSALAQHAQRTRQQQLHVSLDNILTT